MGNSAPQTPSGISICIPKRQGFKKNNYDTMSTAKTINNKSWKANRQDLNFALFHNCIFYSFSCKSRSKSDPHIVIHVSFKSCLICKLPFYLSPFFFFCKLCNLFDEVINRTSWEFSRLDFADGIAGEKFEIPPASVVLSHSSTTAGFQSLHQSSVNKETEVICPC